MNNNLGGNIEIVNRSDNPVFQNTRDNDIVVFTDSTDQSIHIGCGSNATAPSTIRVTSSNLQVNGDITFTGSLLQNGQALQSSMSSSVTGTLSVGGSIIPTSNVVYDLGTSNMRFRDLYLSGNTIDMAGTKLSVDADNSFQIKDSSNNLRKLVVDEIQIGNHQQGGAIRIKKDVNGSVKFTKVVSGVETVDSTVGSSTNVSSTTQSITEVVPAKGFEAGTASIPTTTIRTVPASANIYYGQVELGSHAGTSIENNKSASVKVTHNLGSSSYIVYAMPDRGESVQVNIIEKAANSFTMHVKNVSGGPIANPIVNYQLIQAALQSQTQVLAGPVTITTHGGVLNVYSWNSSTTSVFPITGASDVYPITYSIVSDSTTRASISGSNLTYTHMRQNNSGTIVVKARNAYVDDNSKTITYSLTEAPITSPLSQHPSSYDLPKTLSVTTSNLAAYDQGQPIIWSYTFNSLPAMTLLNNVLTYDTSSALSTCEVILNASFEQTLMGIGLSTKVINMVYPLLDGLQNIWQSIVHYHGLTWTDICYAPELGLFVAVALNSADVLTSSDGATWTLTAAISGDWIAICWSGSKFVAISKGDAIAMTSSNGISWTQHTLPGSSGSDYYSICYSSVHNRFVAVGQNSIIIHSYDDGATWMEDNVTNFYSSINFKSVCATPDGKLVAVGSNENGWCVATYQGSWSQENMGAINPKSICYSQSLNMFVAVGTNRANGSSPIQISTSSDGWSWTDRTAPSVMDWTDVVWSPERSMFLAISSTDEGTTNGVMVSADGITWQGQQTPYMFGIWPSVCWGANKFVAVNYDKLLVTNNP